MNVFGRELVPRRTPQEAEAAMREIASALDQAAALVRLYADDLSAAIQQAELEGGEPQVFADRMGSYEGKSRWGWASVEESLCGVARAMRRGGWAVGLTSYLDPVGRYLVEWKVPQEEEGRQDGPGGADR